MNCTKYKILSSSHLPFLLIYLKENSLFNLFSEGIIDVVFLKLQMSNISRFTVKLQKLDKNAQLSNSSRQAAFRLY